MKILVSMSGGVDSSVVAHLLKAEGHEVIGVQFHLWTDPLAPALAEILPSKCCNAQTVARAKKVASDLGIGLHRLDLSEEFKMEVVDPFIEGHRKGLTPNPCIGCNRTIKFGRLLKLADELGCEKLATGHYARIAKMTSDHVMLSEVPSESPHGGRVEERSRSTSRPRVLLPQRDASTPLAAARSAQHDVDKYVLLEAIDKAKDQSYYLYGLSQEQLSRVLFPLGSMEKSDVFSLAKKFSVPLPEHYLESQDLCFFPEKEPHDFLDRYIEPNSGDIIDTSGKKRGTHQGLHHFTEGQRKGLRIGGLKIPLHVVRKDIESNTLIVGSREESLKNQLTAEFLQWISWVPSEAQEHPFEARIHSLGRREKGVMKHDGKTMRFSFEKPLLGISAGQSIVLYRGEEIVGGGVIS